MYIVTVNFQIDSHHLPEFTVAMENQARQSLAKEAGCHQFDVCYDPGQPNLCFLYEAYSNESAFKNHLQSTHFLEFDKQVKEWLLAKTVNIFERSYPI
jgi:autoinducer 2-degrading protein